MPMKNPPHPGRLLRADVEAIGISVAEAAEGLGITQEALDDVLGGKCAITPEMAVRLEKGVGSSAATWLNLQSAFDLAQARARISTINIERLMPKIAS